MYDGFGNMKAKTGTGLAADKLQYLVEFGNEWRLRRRAILEISIIGS